MNKHLERVREYHQAVSFPQAEHGTSAHLSDMDVIIRQAYLMDGGSETLKALKSGDMALILGGLVNLAYFALGAIAQRGEDLMDRPVSWRHDGFVSSVMRLVSDKINQCTSGKTEHYSEVYCVCAHLANSFLNADFDKAFQKTHQNNLMHFNESGQSIYDEAEHLKKPGGLASDLSDCLFE